MDSNTKTNSLATTSLFLIILNILVGTVFYPYNLSLSLVSIILSVISLNQIKKRQEKGRKRAIIALILSILHILAVILIYVVAASAFGHLHG